MTKAAPANAPVQHFGLRVSEKYLDLMVKPVVLRLIRDEIETFGPGKYGLAGLTVDSAKEFGISEDMAEAVVTKGFDRGWFKPYVLDENRRVVKEGSVQT